MKCDGMIGLRLFLKKCMTAAEEEEVAMVLSGMRQQQQQPPAAPATASPATALEQESFMARVAQMAMVRTLSDAYATGKHSNAVLRVSASAVETGVRTLLDNNITRPVLNQLDHFAGRQLDRLEKTGTSWNQYLSGESVRTLNYCIEWLHFATTHIEAQIALLREGMTTAALVHRTHRLPVLADLANTVKREVVETLRKVVDVISKYAGNALPFEARHLVRGLILSLPTRWATISHSLNSTNGLSAEHEANRVLTLAQESNVMLRNTMAVFGQTVSTSIIQPPQPPQQLQPQQQPQQPQQQQQTDLEQR